MSLLHQSASTWLFIDYFWLLLSINIRFGQCVGHQKGARGHQGRISVATWFRKFSLFVGKLASNCRRSSRLNKVIAFSGARAACEKNCSTVDQKVELIPFCGRWNLVLNKLRRSGRGGGGRNEGDSFMATARKSNWMAIGWQFRCNEVWTFESTCVSKTKSSPIRTTVSLLYTCMY